MDTMPHFIHLHGYYFRVFGSMQNSSFPAGMAIDEVLKEMPQLRSAIARALHLSPSLHREIRHICQKMAGWLCVLSPINLEHDCFTVILIQHLAVSSPVPCLELQSQLRHAVAP